MKKTNLSRTQRLLTVIGAIVFLLFSPAISFVFTPFSALGMIIGILIAGVGISLESIKEFFKTKKGRYVRAVTAILLSVALIWSVYCTSMLIYAGTRTPRDSDTVIVLGCLLKGEEPSRMLRQRLDKAYDYLIDNPKAVAILSGGQGNDEVIPEAVAMYNYLVRRGMPENRLYMEDQSHNTQQNMAYSAEIIRANDLDTNVVVITQAFHQYRASVYAAEYGLRAYALNCRTNIGVLPTYWLREHFSILKMKLVL